MQAALCAWLASVLLVTASTGSAFGAEEPALEFDPILSLTGDCSVSTGDSVPDPGCPEGSRPENAFSRPIGVAVDSYGNIFVASQGQAAGEARIDVFGPEGLFIAEKAIEGGVMNVAVDSDGNLYVIDTSSELLRYPPTKYKPATGEIEYAKAPIVVALNIKTTMALAVNAKNQHVFTSDGHTVVEYSSATEENKVLDKSIGSGTLSQPYGAGLTIDAARGLVYVSDYKTTETIIKPSVIRVFELNAPHAEVGVIDGSTTPEGKFLGAFLSVAVDEGTGNVFVYDGEGKNVVYEFTKDGKYVATIDHGFKYVSGLGISVDNGENSPNGALNSFGRYLFVPSHPSGTGHSFAFGPAEECAPEIKGQSFTAVTEGEANLGAEINPCNLETAYTFEYTTQESFDAEGFAGASVAGEGVIPAGLAPVPVSAAAVGLEPGTAYRFRVVATNELGSDEAVGQFSTYPATPVPPCSNDGVRAGLGAMLPDCRAYELVTPPDTNARAPMGVARLGTYFATREASPAGDALSFEIQGGALPGGEGTGSFAGDPYLATRGDEGWDTAYVGPSGEESPAVLLGSNSPDQGYSLWSTAGGLGSAAIEGKQTNYVRYPDGHSTLVGRGSLGTDPRAVGGLISEGGGHIIFMTGGVGGKAVQLEPNAPPAGTDAVYDRTADEVTHVVSLLPGDVTPSAGQNAAYKGASLDGRGIAFSVGEKLYLRFNNQESYEVGENVTFEGVAEGGARIFYLKAGDLFAFDAQAGEAIRFTEAGDVTPVNVAADGTAVYFVSPSVLVGEEENPNGAKAQAGKENLYLSQEGAISFVGTMTERDVEGDLSGEPVGGLGLWTNAVGSQSAPPGRFGEDPSRTTPDGSVLLFESRADLAGYDSKEHAEIYRFDSVGGVLQCLSCNPTQAAASSDASLQSLKQGQLDQAPFSSYAYLENIRADGRRAFFQSREPLVPTDVDGLQDVYEWEDQGVGSCAQPGGCVYLISSGQSNRDDYLYAVSDGGDSVFFRSPDLLLSSDRDETPSIYDARVEGGFPNLPGSVCEGEGCNLGVPAPPSMLSPESGPHDEGSPVKSCPKSKRKVVRHGKVRCLKKHHKKRHRKRSSRNKGGTK